jgi:IS5 family transposase
MPVGTGYIHTITATTTNVHDIDQAAGLVCEDDTVIYGDAGYLGVKKRGQTFDIEIEVGTKSKIWRGYCVLS